MGLNLTLMHFWCPDIRLANPKVCNKKSGYNDYSIGPSYSFEVVFNRRVDVGNLLCWWE